MASPSPHFLLIFVSILWSPFFSPACALNGEGAALLAFVGSITEDPEGSLSNWNSSDPSPCSWNGVTCKDGGVVALSLPRKRLAGFLPSSLGSLSSLRHINLRSNRLSGPLPPEIFAAGRIQSLVLSSNSFYGSIPPELGNATYLQILDLSLNSLNSSVPVSLLRCRKLRSLVLSHNSFTGPLPAGIGISLPFLETLDLSYNALTGSIPSDIGNLSSLQGNVDLSHNTFSGLIPPSLGNLPEKVFIDLSYNNLSGPIPQTGVLENRGPTAFLGNPGLCGSPLRKLCPSDVSSNPFLPGDYAPVGSKGNVGQKGLSKGAIVAITVSDVAAVSLIALILFYCYRRAVFHKHEAFGRSARCGKDCVCFGSDEPATPSYNHTEQFDLVPLDREVRYNLDELLKASAFVLGKSGIGIMYKVVLEDGLTLAVRRLGEGGLQRFKEFRDEVEAIGKVRHPNLVTLRAYYWSIDEKLLVYDYIPNGTLSTALHGKLGSTATFTPLTWAARLMIMKGVAHGLAFLHEFSPKKYVHGDLRPNNILLGPNMEPCIGDFGLSHLASIAGGPQFIQSDRIGAEKAQNEQWDAAALCYQAPEAMRTLKPSQKWDVYSFGVILLETLSGKSPAMLMDTLQMDIVSWVQFCIEEKKPSTEVLDPYLSADFTKEDEMIAVLKVALACIDTLPERRPTMRLVVDALERVGDANW